MASALRVALGHTVRALRTAAGYSQEGFADALKVHRTYMGSLERGKANPSLEILELIAQGLRIEVSELLRAAETGRLPAVERLNTPPPRRRRGAAPRPERVADR